MLHTVDIGAAGTAMRFATAYFAATSGEYLLTGSARMKQRPIRVLVEALRALGAHIDYTEREGFPPLRITGHPLEGGEVCLPADVSSQYISALLMVAPMMARGLRLRLQGEILSRPYIDMTLALMQRYGAQAAWEDASTLYVAAGTLAAQDEIRVECDWSAASYWYEAVVLCPDTEARVFLPSLTENSVQGDSICAKLFAPLGVATTFTPEGATLTRQQPSLPTGTTYEVDFSTCPDLAQTLVATCCALRRPFVFTGLQSLRIKETDRIAALCTELGKLGYTLHGTASTIAFTGQCATPATQAVCIATYADHRMAMSFAPLSTRHPALCIESPEVVSKSYPRYWHDLQAAGYTLT